MSHGPEGRWSHRQPVDQGFVRRNSGYVMAFPDVPARSARRDSSVSRESWRWRVDQFSDGLERRDGRRPAPCRRCADPAALAGAGRRGGDPGTARVAGSARLRHRAAVREPAGRGPGRRWRHRATTGRCAAGAVGALAERPGRGALPRQRRRRPGRAASQAHVVRDRRPGPAGKPGGRLRHRRRLVGAGYVSTGTGRRGRYAAAWRSSTARSGNGCRSTASRSTTACRRHLCATGGCMCCPGTRSNNCRSCPAVHRRTSGAARRP